MDHAHDLSIVVSDFLKAGNRSSPRKPPAWLSLLTAALSSFPLPPPTRLHSKMAKGCFSKFRHRQSILILFYLIHTRNAKRRAGFPEGAGIPQNSVVAQNLRSLGHQIRVGETQCVQGSLQFCRGQGEREFLQGYALLTQNGMQPELDIVRNNWVCIFSQRTSIARFSRKPHPFSA